MRHHQSQEMRAETAPSALTDFCSVERDCLEALETDDVEQYDSQTDEFINDMVSLSETWGMALAEMPDAIAARREIEDSHEGWTSALDDRSMRRQLDRRKDSYFLQTVTWAHNAGRWAARPNVPADAPRLGAITDPVDLARRIGDIGETLSRDEDEQDTLVKQFKLLFVAEELAHAQMAMLELTNPSAFRDIFRPGSIDDLPPALRELSAADIARDKDSIILRNARRDIDDNRTPGQQLADYLSNNHLPDSIRQVFVGINLGAKAMGAPACPRNDVGICTKVLERLPIDELPEPVRRDMEIRAGKATQERVAKLTQFARGHMPSRLFDSSVVYDIPDNDHAVSSKKRRQVNTGRGATKADRSDVTFEALEASLETAFSSVSVLVSNEDGEPFVFNVDEEASFDHLLETKMFKDYMTAHRETGLDAMFQNALQHILFSPRYAETKGMIIPLVDRTLKTHQNQSGVTERLMRFSGQKTSAMGSGKNGRQTRIIFSQGTKDGVRHVTIRKVVHKSNIEKGIRI